MLRIVRQWIINLQGESISPGKPNVNLGAIMRPYLLLLTKDEEEGRCLLNTAKTVTTFK